MNKAYLILKDEKPTVINIAENITSLRWTLANGEEVELEVLTAYVPSHTGDSLGYLIATNIDDLHMGHIRMAVESINAQ